MNVVRRFGGVAAVLLGTGRKAMTLVLSFVFFPKAFSWFYVWGGVLVLGGLLFSSLHKIQQKNTTKKNSSSKLLLQHNSSDLGGSINMMVPIPETNRLLGVGGTSGAAGAPTIMDDQNGPYDIEHQHEVYVKGVIGNGNYTADVMSTLDMMTDDEYESLTTSVSRESAFLSLSRSSSHDHQQ